MTLRALIVEDEPASRERLQDLLVAQDVEVVAACESAGEAVTVLARERVDALFLDVQLPGESGFDVLRQRGDDGGPVLVFVTAHDRYALSAFDERAVDFLLKPYDEDRFREALRRVREAVEARRAGSLTERVESLVDKARGDQGRLIVRSAGRITFLKTNEIEWLDAAGNSVQIHAAGKAHRVRTSLQAIERQLDPRRFARVHRSTIVNLDRVQEVLVSPHGDYVVVTDGGRRLTVGRSHRERLQALMAAAAPE